MGKLNLQDNCTTQKRVKLVMKMQFKLYLYNFMGNKLIEDESKEVSLTYIAIRHLFAKCEIYT